ncbi:MAG: tRNA (guanosine(46)-N7)-methyltransferase TrmB [Deltaproteobacteria bacterium]|nr:tRNA (guanosine(46)-N7)-methyltransferase TrmB [Deltaproteobacteria bacterium]
MLEKTTTQRVIPIESPSFVREEHLREAGNPVFLFPRRCPLAMEIGCGTGDFIVQLARRRPDLNFLAVDIYNQGCLKTCRKVDRQQLDNIRVLRMEARYLMTRYLGPASLEALYLNCPDPWPKKRHHPRRLVNAGFLEMVRYFLAAGGEFFFCTDFSDYAQQVAALFPFPGLDNCLPAPCVSRLEGYPFSKYMRNFSESGQPLYFMRYRKASRFPGSELAPPPFSASNSPLLGGGAA